MSAQVDPLKLTVLQRLDLTLAERLAQQEVEKALAADLSAAENLPITPEVDRREWIASMLGLRGLHIRPADVQVVLAGEESRFDPDHHEHALIIGLHRVLQRLQDVTAAGRPPDGWFMAELFKLLSKDVARFRNNRLRRDMPWDAVVYVNYPKPEEVSNLLDAFNLENCYLDHPVRFRSLHPVRQACRILWRFARIAPFPDFNMTMAFIAMNCYLRYRGYPMLYAQRSDREKLHRLVTGPVPMRILSFETRMLSMVQDQAKPAT